MITAGRIVRLAERGRAQLHFFLDGQIRSALAGDTVLTAMLASGHALRMSEFGSEPRAGFCLMGACQDCWVWLADHSRVRACTTMVTDGISVLSRPPSGFPPHEGTLRVGGCSGGFRCRLRTLPRTAAS